MRADACPTSQELADWLEGAAQDGSSAELEAHIETCEICKVQIERIESGDLLLAELKGIAGGSGDASLDRNRLSRITAAYRKAEKAKLSDYPARIRDYELLEILGQGGMGTVFRARHVPLNRLVALKILPPDSGQRVERFQRELAHHGPLDHPHIVKALDAGEAEGVHFLVTELVDGHNAAQLVADKGPLGAKEACEIARQAALGLAYLHERGLVHRDVKPSNLMIDASGHVRLLDLGLVAPVEEESPDDRMTKDKTILGTPDYLAPEQINDPHGVGPAADLYGLGCTIFHLLAGQPPFAEYPLLQKLHAHQYEEPDMRRIPTPMAPEFIQLLAQLLAKQPALRPASASLVAQRLTAFAPLEHNEYASVVMPAKPPVVAPPHRSNGNAVFIVFAVLGVCLALPLMLVFCAGVIYFFSATSTVMRPNEPFPDERPATSAPTMQDENATGPATPDDAESHGGSVEAPQPQAVSALQLGFHSQPLTSIAFAPDGNSAYTAGAHQVEPLLAWDLTARRQSDSAPAGPVLTMSIHPTDPTLLLLGVAHELVIWDIKAKKDRERLACSGIVTCIATSSGADKVAVGTSLGEVTFWNLKTHERTGKLEYQGAITALTMSRGGGLIACATDRRQVSIWDSFREATPGQMTVNDQAIALAFNNDATALFVIEGYSDRHRSRWQRVIKFDLDGSYRYETSIAETGELCLAAAIGENRLLIGCADGSVRCWSLDADRARVLWRKKIHEQPVSALALSASGDKAISGARDGSVYLLELR